MSPFACHRQPEVVELLARGHYPDACSDELRAHMDGCHACSELARVTHAFQQARACTVPMAALPAPGAIWWRAQLRRRHAAIERVSHPLFGAYVFALSVVLLGGMLLAATEARHGLQWLQALAQSSTAALHLDAQSSASWLSSASSLGILIPILASAAVVGAVVVYFSGERR